jgi:hypothetical protein
MDNACVSLVAGTAASTTRSVNDQSPVSLGVPEMVPVDALRTSPGGNDPTDTDHTNGAFPPDREIVVA